LVELDQLSKMLQEVTLGLEPDERSCFFEDAGHRLVSGLVYKASTHGDHDCASYSFVWKNFAPPRVKFFGWLLTQNRIHCPEALACKNILDDATCEICKASEESADHILSACPFIQTFWTSIGWFPGNIAKVKEMWNTQPPPHIAKKVLHPLLLLLFGKFGSTGTMSSSAGCHPTSPASPRRARSLSRTGADASREKKKLWLTVGD
jgi:hypothetical protein